MQAHFFDDIQVVRRHRRTDPSTSRLAAANAAATFAATQAGRVLNALRLHGNMTAGEMHIIGLTTVQAARRLADLQMLGLVEVLTVGGADVVRNGCRAWRACGVV